MRYINHKSDFQVVVNIKDKEGNIIAPPSVPWEAVFSDENGVEFKCSYDGTNYTHCIVDFSDIVCFVDNPGFACGKLRCTFHQHVPSEDYCDGVMDLTQPLQCDIMLSKRESDDSTPITIEASPNWVIGPQGEQGIQGPQGIKGEKGDKGERGLQGVQGVKGDDGVSPTVTTSKTGKVTTIEITDANGVHTATVNDGESVEVVQSTGTSTTAVMSQKAVSDIVDELESKVNAADEEDITSENGLLKLKDRSALNGMGYVILRQNKDFAEQVTKANTIYEIRYDFDLNGAEITVPENCVLKFNGGSLSNGTINGNTTEIKAKLYKIFKDITTTGTFKQDKIYVEWFGEIDEDNCHLTIQRAINSNISPNICLINNYKVKAPILIDKSCYLFGSASNINTLSKISTTEDFNGESVIIDRGTSEFKDLAFYTREDIDTIHSYSSAQFNHCEFYRGKVAIKYVGQGTVNVKINNCRFSYQTNNGIEFSSNTTYNTANIISNNYFNSCGSPDGNFNPTAEPSEMGKGNGIYSATTQSNLRIENNTFEYCYGFGIQLDANATGNHDILILGNYFEGNRNGSFYLDILNSEQDLIYSNFTSYPYEKSRNSYVYSHNTPYIIQYNTSVPNRIDISKSIIKSLEDRISSDRIYLNLDSWENIQDILFDPSFYKIIDTKHVVTTISDTPKLRLYLKRPTFIRIKYTYKAVSGAFGLYQVYEEDKYSSYITGLYGFVNTFLVDNQWHTLEYITPCFPKYVSTYYKYTGFKIFQNSPGECYISEFEAELVEMPNLSELEELSPLMNGVKAFYNNILYYYNNVWIPIGNYKGTTNKRPILTADYAGFQYYDTTLKKYIVWNGTEWTNMDGTNLI